MRERIVEKFERLNDRNDRLEESLIDIESFLQKKDLKTLYKRFKHNRYQLQDIILRIYHEFEKKEKILS